MLDKKQRTLCKLTESIAQSCHWLDIAAPELEQRVGADNACTLRNTRHRLLERLIQDLLLEGIPARLLRERLQACRCGLDPACDPLTAWDAACAAERFVISSCRRLPATDSSTVDIMTTLHQRPIERSAA